MFFACILHERDVQEVHDGSDARLIVKATVGIDYWKKSDLGN